MEEDFYKFLRDIDTSKVTLSAMLEGSIVFPKIPLIRVEGPLPGMQCEIPKAYGKRNVKMLS